MILEVTLLALLLSSPSAQLLSSLAHLGMAINRAQQLGFCSLAALLVRRRQVLTRTGAHLRARRLSIENAMMERVRMEWCTGFFLGPPNRTRVWVPHPKGSGWSTPLGWVDSEKGGFQRLGRSSKPSNFGWAVKLGWIW